MAAETVDDARGGCRGCVDVPLVYLWVAAKASSWLS